MTQPQDFYQLPENWQQALTAILETDTMTAAAEACGLSRRTLYRYLDNEQFLAALRHEETKLIDGVSRQLVKMAADAVKALKDVLDKPTQDGASNKRLAAVAILDQIYKIRDIRTIEMRLAELETNGVGNEFE